MSRPWLRWNLAASLALCCLQAAPAPAWKLARSAHFEVYSQSNEDSARSVLLWFEQLRAFFAGLSGLAPDDTQPVRVIVFASAQEYQPYRLRPFADAYYVGLGSRNSIVMAESGQHEFQMAAHEYAHLILRSAGLQLPRWLNEGLADFFSTVLVGGHAVELGAGLPGRIQVLLRHPWMSLSQLLQVTETSKLGGDRTATDLFYAQSWALTEMLLRSPGYRSQFPALLAALRSGTPGELALRRVYGRSPAGIARDLHDWLVHDRPGPIRLPGVDTGEVLVRLSDVPPLASRLLLADVLLTAGELDRAEALYRALASDAPAEAAAALGSIALRRDDSEGARREWKQAIALGIQDAALCYRYAILADQAGLSADEIRPALQRAILLQPDYDDARYQLALLEKNSGHYQAALAQFLAMHAVGASRAYPYWMAVADTDNELNRREEAQAAATKAVAYAATPQEKALAAEQAYIAQTDLNVQFARGADGQTQLVTTRSPHASRDWNPFVEAGDDLRRVEATLEQVDCSAPVLRVRLLAAGKPLTLDVPDPSRVQMRNAPSEFVCGPQEHRPVLVEYAASPDGAGVLRGMEFR